MTNELNTVLYCRFCGNLNPEGSGLRCSQCGAYSGMETVVEEEARRRSRRVRLDFLRSRITRIAIVVVPLLMLLVWVLWGYTGFAARPATADDKHRDDKRWRHFGSASAW